jgi:membrane dipeptidase
MTRRSSAALVLLAAAIAAPLDAQQSDAQLAHARRLLESTILVDGHNDLPWEIRRSRTAPLDVAAYDLRARTPGHTDLARLKEGLVGAQFWSVYVPGEVGDSGYARIQLEEIDIARRMIERYPELVLALTADDIVTAKREGKIASLLGMEGGHVIENSLGALRAYYALGARYLTLTHNVTIDWADAASDTARHGGLTDFGTEVVHEMNRLGMLVDLSHVSPATMSDVLDVTEAPVIFSHSSARALTDHVRNVPDSILRRLPANGGVVMVTFVPDFISQKRLDASEKLGADLRARMPELEARLAGIADSTERARARRAIRDSLRSALPQATITDVADHIEHVRKVAGVDHVGIGGDFDGIDTTPVGLEDVASYPRLFAELIRRGWSDADLKKLAGENVLRAMRAAEATAARLQKEREPSTRTLTAPNAAS